MKTKPIPPSTVDEYIAAFPGELQRTLRKIRTTIRKAAPAAQEKISYQIPGYTLNGPLIYFAAYKKHIGVYPAPKGTAQFNKQIAPYKAFKSTIRFPLDKPIPYDLLTQIVELRLKENLKAQKEKK